MASRSHSQPRKSKTPWIVAVLLLVGAIALFRALQPEASQPADTPPSSAPVPAAEALTVSTALAEVRTLTHSVTINAHVTASKEVGVAPKISGTVAEVTVEVGDAVEAGQILVRLEDEELRAQYQQAVAAQEGAEAHLARLEAGATREEREQAAAALRQAQLNLEQARRHLERMEQLFEEQVVSQEQLDAARTQFGVAQAQYETAEQQVKRLEQGATPEDLRAARAQVAQAKAARELARLQLEYAQIKAPFSGLVARRDVEPGRLVGAGLSVITLVDIDRVYVQGAVSQAHVSHVRVGEPVEVDVAAVGTTVTGRVYSVSPSADAAGLFPVRVEVENRDHLLKPGMFATVRIPLQRVEEAVAIPAAAVVRRGDERAVFVAEPEPADSGSDGVGAGNGGRPMRRGVARLRIVQLGIEEGDWVQVTHGLEPGERVVVAGHSFLSDGRAIMWTQEE